MEGKKQTLKMVGDIVEKLKAGPGRLPGNAGFLIQTLAGGVLKKPRNEGSTRWDCRGGSRTAPTGAVEKVIISSSSVYYLPVREKNHSPLEGGYFSSDKMDQLSP